MSDAGSGVAPALQPPGSTPAEVSNSAETRYKDAYRVAAFVTGFGTFIKILSVVLGVIIVFAGLIAGSNSSSGIYGRYESSSSSFTGVTGLVMGVMTLIFGFTVGVIVSALGQLYKAALDSAVHSSPFLDPLGKARAMGLSTAIPPAISEADRQAIANLQKNWPGYS
jgi:hypothetical protein